MSALAAIHVAKKQLGLDEDTYRALLVRETGKASAKGMSAAEHERVIEAMRRQGFTKASTGSRKRLEGRFAKKLQALWISAWNLGLVDNRADEALIAFVKRQTGIDHVRFVRHPEDAAKAIEALKGWMAREAGVDWSVEPDRPPHTRMPGFKIANAQFVLLRRINPAFAEFNSLQHWLVMSRAERPGRPVDVVSHRAEDWRVVMNALGEPIRKAAR